MGLKAGIKVYKYFTKPSLSFSVTEGFLGKAGKYTAEFTKDGKPTELTKALIGDTSVAIADNLKMNFGDALLDMKYMFMDTKSLNRVFGRPKSAQSITTKLERTVLKRGGLSSFEEGLSIIGDGIGTRGIMESLPRLSDKEITSRILATTFNGKPLSNRQVELLERYIYERPIDVKHQEEAYQLFKEFATPLVEKHSQEAVDYLTMGMLAGRIKRGEITLEQIKNEGLLDKSLIAQFESKLNTQDIIPMNITEINNYRGAHGLAYFSDSQMAQMNYAMGLSSHTGTVIKRSASSSRYGYIQDSSSLEQAGYGYIEKSKAIKPSGYNTCQMNIVHQNGALGEFQFRGSYINDFAEYEHLAYDLRQGKNTLGPVFNEFAEVVSKLPDSQYQVYNKYLESCYNYFHRLELGLPAKKPVLPETLNPILSMDSLKALHDKGEMVKKVEEFGFTPYFEAVA